MAGPTVQCRDEMGDGQWLMEYKLPVEGERLTVRDFIRARIEHETSTHNAELDRGRSFRGLVFEPPAVTSDVNGFHDRKRTGKTVDADVMLKIAVEAYERGDLVLVVDDEQAGDIESDLVVSDDSLVLFRKRVPLVVPQLKKGRRRRPGSAREMLEDE
jgi:hypothetical protein